jgi:hypothetical protein
VLGVTFQDAVSRNLEWSELEKCFLPRHVDPAAYGPDQVYIRAPGRIFVEKQKESGNR